MNGNIITNNKKNIIGLIKKDISFDEYLSCVGKIISIITDKNNNVYVYGYQIDQNGIAITDSSDEVVQIQNGYNGSFISKFDKSGKYIEIESNAEEQTIIKVPKGTASAHINTSQERSAVLVLANVSWKPNDNEMMNVTFNDYNWKKWKLKST